MKLKGITTHTKTFDALGKDFKLAVEDYHSY